MPDDEESKPLEFLTLDQVAHELVTSHTQVYAVRRAELQSLKMGAAVGAAAPAEPRGVHRVPL